MGSSSGGNEALWEFIAAGPQAKIADLSMLHATWILLKVFHVPAIIYSKSSK